MIWYTHVWQNDYHGRVGTLSPHIILFKIVEEVTSQIYPLGFHCIIQFC